MFNLVRKESDGWEVVELHGELDQLNITTFKSQIEELLESTSGRFLFDLTDLKFISSEGLSILLWFRFQLEKKEGEVRAVISNVSGFLHKIFNITKLDAHFEIVPDGAEFLSQVSGVKE